MRPLCYFTRTKNSIGVVIRQATAAAAGAAANAAALADPNAVPCSQASRPTATRPCAQTIAIAIHGLADLNVAGRCVRVDRPKPEGGQKPVLTCMAGRAW